MPTLNLRAINRLAILGLVLSAVAAGQDIRLEQLDLTQVAAPAPPFGYPAQAARSVGGGPIVIRGLFYDHGVGLHSGSKLLVDLGGQAQTFTALAGLDDAWLPLPRPLPEGDVLGGRAGNAGTATVEIWLDGKRAFDTGPGRMTREDPPRSIAVNLRGVRRMAIIVTDGGRWPYNNPVDLANAIIVMEPGATASPIAVRPPAEPEPAIASGDSPEPAIHGPRVTGASVGRSFLYRIPATGEGPLRFSATSLPVGLQLDPDTGLITGAIQSTGSTVVRLEVASSRGKAARDLKIVAGDRPLALTPFMGWSSWNAWAHAADDAKIREAADALVTSGLAAHGYAYVVVDGGCWEGRRDGAGEMHSNAKFPDLRALAGYIHAKGLKFGIYTSPGPTTCDPRIPGSYRHEAQDAATFARWGVDFLFYDLCSYNQFTKPLAGAARIEAVRKPYALMGEILRRSPRDIIFKINAGGQNLPGEWGPGAGVQAWRTAFDIRDSWENISDAGFGEAGREKWAGPGRWNDPDYLAVGSMGWGVEPRPSRLTPNEQLTQMSLWSLLAAPLEISCDLNRLDPFTFRLLADDEVLDIDQDPLGKQAVRRARDGLLEVWVKPLSDGTEAVGLFNRGIAAATATAAWRDLGLEGPQPIRDLWRHENLGVFNEVFSARVPAHGAVLLKIGRPLIGR